MPAERITSIGRPYVVLYRWRLKAGSESSFVQAWSRVTEHYREHHGSLGSRLHLGSDGIWYGYAQWPSAEARERAFSQRGSGSSDHGLDASCWEAMNEATLERFPEIELETRADYLVLSKN